MELVKICGYEFDAHITTTVRHYVDRLTEQLKDSTRWKEFVMNLSRYRKMHIRSHTIHLTMS